MSVRVEGRTAPVPGAADLEQVVSAFRGTAPGDPAACRVSICRPTAAFSRRDVLQPGYEAAASVVAGLGYDPVVRPVGGRLALYDEGSVVVHAWLPTPHARDGIRARFAAFGQLASGVLGSLGVPDVRVGAVPGEYCAGEWSVNVAGRHKLVGTGQRVRRDAVLFCAVVTVSGAERLGDALRPAYAALGVDFDPASVGSVDRWVPGVAAVDVAAVFAEALADPLALFGPRS